MKAKKTKPVKEKSFIWYLWMIAVERWKRRRAERLLIHQEWSVHLLVMLLAKAARLKQHGVVLVLKNKSGQELHMMVDNPQVQRYVKQEDEVDVRQNEVTLDALLNQAEIDGVF